MIEPEFNRFLRSIVETLEQLGLTYGIGGSVASSLYGEARSTLDVDISVVLPLDRVLAFTQAFQALGYYAFLDAILDAIVAHQPFNIIDAQRGYKADIFPVDSDAPTPKNGKSSAGCNVTCMMSRMAPRRCCIPLKTSSSTSSNTTSSAGFRSICATSAPSCLPKVMLSTGITSPTGLAGSEPAMCGQSFWPLTTAPSRKTRHRPPFPQACKTCQVFKT